MRSWSPMTDQVRLGSWGCVPDCDNHTRDSQMCKETHHTQARLAAPGARVYLRRMVLVRSPLHLPTAHDPM